MDELTTKRLAIIKQLYQTGITQSYDPEPMNGFCLLSFHDSVEMFMKLCAEVSGVKIDRNTNFGDYFTKIPKLLCQATMTNLNNKRIALKHYGSLPSKLDIEISRANVSDFFIQNTPVFFDIQFDEISLVLLIKYVEVQKYLLLAIETLNNNDYENSIINSQIAFKELLFSYEDDKRYQFSSPFAICERFSSPGRYRNIGLSKELDRYIDDTKDAFLRIDDAIKILGFQIDYKKYIKFKILMPYITVWDEKEGRSYETMKNERVNYSKRNAQFCFDFVIESALKLQEFDFEINELCELRVKN